MSIHKEIKAIWIDELRSLGITEGPNDEPLESMDYQHVKSYLVKIHNQLDIGIDLDAKANAFF